MSRGGGKDRIEVKNMFPMQITYLYFIFHLNNINYTTKLSKY